MPESSRAARLAGRLPPVPPVPPPGLSFPPRPGSWLPSTAPSVVGWSLGSALGISPPNDPPATVAGHVNAIIAAGTAGVLAGADTGGVWQLVPNPAAPGTPAAHPLSNDWQNPDIRCLAAGPDSSDHAYAGCRSLSESLPIPYSGIPVLYEAPPGSPGAWTPIMTTTTGGPDYGTVYAIGVAGRRLLVATSTGLWTAPIPDPGATGTGRAYTWQTATWQGDSSSITAGGCTGMVIASGQPVVSAGAGGTIWRGSFGPTGELVLSQSFDGIGNAARSSLAVCAGSQANLWCVISTADNAATVAAVLASTDGGQSWQPVSGTVSTSSGVVSLAAAAAGQGDYNNCIATSPVHPSTVLIGWEAGVFASFDGGVTYQQWPVPPLHFDVHALYFDPRDAKGQTVFVGSDGGVAVTVDLGSTFDTTWNQNLADLQVGSVPCHNGYGTMTADPTVPGRVAVGLQDNGVAWSQGGIWQENIQGDGAAAIFTADGSLVAATLSAYGTQILRYQNGSYQPVSTPPYFHPDGSEAVLVITNADGTQTIIHGLPNPVLEAVRAPGKASPAVYAVGGNGPQAEPNSLFGLRWSQPDASDAKWDRLATLPAGMEIWSVAAVDETRIYVGTHPARVYQLTMSASGWSPVDLGSLPTLVPGTPDPYATITRLVPLADGSVLAAYSANAYSGGANAGQILHYTAGGWTPINGPGSGTEPVFGLDVDDWGVLYAATDDGLYVAAWPGAQWQDMSAGLPTRAHLGSVRFVHYASGGIDLFLATWGRSVWKATWGSAQPNLGAGPGLSYNQLVGSLVDGRLYQLGPGGLVPVGPIDPELEQAGLQTSALLGARAGQLAAVLSSPAEAAVNDTAGALQQVSALSNLLQRGIATLHSVSSASQLRDGTLLARYTRAGTAMVTEAAAALARQTGQGLADEVGIVIRLVVAAVTAHAQAMAELAKAASIRS